VIKAATRAARDFQQDDVLFLQALADLFAEALERRGTQRELNASRERYRNVLEGAAEIIVSLSVDGRILTLNKAFERITGWPAAAWLGRQYLDLIVEDGRATARARLAAALTKHHASPNGIAIGLHTASGEVRELEVSAVAIEEQGAVVEIFAFGRDVTERRRIEEARTRLADELALILNSVGEGIYGFDIDGRCTMMNRAAADMLGYEPGACIGTAVEAIHGTNTAASVSPLLHTIVAGKSAHVAEAMFTTVEGSLLPVEFSASPLIANDAVVGGVVCFSDISRRRQLEAQLEQERRLSSLGKLAASVAHEFNNVLMGIGPSAEIIGTRLGPDDTLAMPVKQIRGAVQRGKRITEEILRFANPTPPAVAPFDADTWITRLEAETRNLLTQQHELEIESEPGLVVVGDAPQLSQVALNLILNARDAMPHGGRLTIKARRARPADGLRFALPREAEAYAHLSVRDSGSGIAREHLDHIFEPLFTTKRSGTGLGLPISRQIVKQHQGEMFVDTDPGIGTTFHIFVPAAAVAAAVETEQPTNGRLPGQLTVLIVEDDPHVAAGLRLALETEGVIVHHVSTGSGALRAIGSFVLDAAIIDVGLPDMDGTKVFEQGIKGRKIPVIFSTGHADQARIAPYLTDRSVAYLRKPYSISVLLDTLAGVLR
jgi:two-component system cell cycle sensor histidine kinase/response regulator CckA